MNITQRTLQHPGLRLALLCTVAVGLWGCPSSTPKKTNIKKIVKPPEKSQETKDAEAMGLEVDTWRKYKQATAELRKDKPNPEVATTALLAVIEKKPDFAEAHYNLAMIYERQGKVEEAKKHLAKAREIDPDAQEYKVAIGRIYAESKDYDKAETLFNEALARDPDSAAAKNNLAILALKRKDYDKAKKYVIEILRDDDENVDALLTLGLIYKAKKNLSLSKLVFVKALCAAGEKLSDCAAAEDKKVDPKAKDAKKADPKAQPKAPATKVKVTKKKKQISPALLASLYNNFAFVFLAENNEASVQNAVSSFGKANKADPTYLQSRLNLGAILIEYLDYKRADEQFKQAMDIAPANCIANLGRGATLFALGKHKDSEVRYQFYVDKCDKAHISSLERLAKLNEGPLKNYGKAVGYYRTLLGLTTDAKKQTQYKAMIKFLESQQKQSTPKKPDATKEAPKKEAPKTDATKTEAPKTDATKPAETKPAETKPAEKAPAETKEEPKKEETK